MVGNWSTAPVGPTSGPKAGPILQIAVQAAVSAVRVSSPVRASAAVKAAKMAAKAVNITITEETTVFFQPLATQSQGNHLMGAAKLAHPQLDRLEQNEEAETP